MIIIETKKIIIEKFYNVKNYLKIIFGNVLGKKAVFLIQNTKALRVVDLAK